MLSPKKGDRVLDVCAAPGGKSVTMAEMMQNDGMILACDLYTQRLKLIEENAKKTSVDINDGEILDNSLDLCQKDENYIYKILKKEKKKVSDIFIMTLDGIGNYNIILKDKQN